MYNHAHILQGGWSEIIKKVNYANCTTDGRREYDKKRLSYPSEYAVRHFVIIVKETNEYLEKNPEVNLITKEIKEHVLSIRLIS